MEKSSNPPGPTCRYWPKPALPGVSDQVLFTEPGSLVIERTFPDGSRKTCSTTLAPGPRTGNAWTAADLKRAISVEAVQQVLRTGSNELQLDTTLGGEGESFPFEYQQHGNTLKVMPPDAKTSGTPRVGKDFAGLVYVLTRIYQQQLGLQECVTLGHAP